MCTVVWSLPSTKHELLAPDTEATAATACTSEPGAIIWCTLRRIGKGKAALSFETLLGKDNPFKLAPLDAALDAVDAWADELGGEWLRELMCLDDKFGGDFPLSVEDMRELKAYVAGMRV